MPIASQAVVLFDDIIATAKLYLCLTNVVRTAELAQLDKAVLRMNEG